MKKEYYWLLGGLIVGGFATYFYVKSQTETTSNFARNKINFSNTKN
jgi:hypothetical protein